MTVSSVIKPRADGETFVVHVFPSQIGYQNLVFETHSHAEKEAIVDDVESWLRSHGWMPLRFNEFRISDISYVCRRMTCLEQMEAGL